MKFAKNAPVQQKAARLLLKWNNDIKNFRQKKPVFKRQVFQKDLDSLI